MGSSSSTLETKAQKLQAAQNKDLQKKELMKNLDNKFKEFIEKHTVIDADSTIPMTEFAGAFAGYCANEQNRYNIIFGWCFLYIEKLLFLRIEDTIQITAFPLPLNPAYNIIKWGNVSKSSYSSGYFITGRKIVNYNKIAENAIIWR